MQTEGGETPNQSSFSHFCRTPRKATYEVGVDLVADDGQLVARRDVDDVQQVAPRVDGAARVGRVVDDDGGGALVDQRLEVIQVDLPLPLRLQAESHQFSSIIIKETCLYSRGEQLRSPVNLRVSVGSLSCQTKT